MSHYDEFRPGKEGYVKERINLDEQYDNVNKPKHYTSHPSGIECIEITQHMNFCLGNAFKYLWRSGIKSDNAIEDLQKSVWYIQKEIERLTKEAK